MSSAVNCNLETIETASPRPDSKQNDFTSKPQGSQENDDANFFGVRRE
jgi:hypothetical protein